MLKTGVQTGYFDFFNYNDPDSALKKLKEYGFEAIDFNIDRYVPIDDLLNGSLKSFFDKPEEEVFDHFKLLKAASEKHGVAISQMHAPFPGWMHGKEEYNAYMKTVLEKCIAVCGFVGCPAIVVHPENSGPREEMWENNLNFYRSLIPVAKKHGVTICTENTFKTFNGRPVEGICSCAEECARLVDTLNAEAGEKLFGVCFDMGHATLLGYDMYEFIIKLGDRLTLLHIHDNDGVFDHHMMPYTFTRNWGKFLITDWEGFIKGLADVGFDGVLSFETFNVTRAFPAPLWPEVMRLLSATGRYWIDRINKIRAGE